MGSLTGLIPGIQTNGWGTAVQVGSSAAFGGIVADLSGGNFWNGATQAAIIAGFNHAAHSMLDNPEYEYNGKTYTSKTELYGAILAD
jgi:hypothetical protein